MGRLTGRLTQKEHEVHSLLLLTEVLYGCHCAMSASPGEVLFSQLAEKESVVTVVTLVKTRMGTLRMIKNIIVILYS